MILNTRRPHYDHPFRPMSSSVLKYAGIALIAAVIFIPFLGQAHLFDWDEANFAECAREMVLSGNWMRVQVNFQPFWEKPPLFIWMQAISMSIFGINEFAARLPNAVMGIVTLCTLFYVGKKVADERTATTWIGLYLASWLPHLYFKSAIIDPTFNFFIFLAFYKLWCSINSAKHQLLHAGLCGALLGLATLTKGPVAILITLLSFGVYLVIKRFHAGINWKQILTVAVSCTIVTSIWFGIDIIQNGWWFTNEFIIYQIRLLTTGDAGHSGPFYYHWIVLLIGCFPASVFLLGYFRRTKNIQDQRPQREFTLWMWILFGVTLILFSLVKTKIVHYSSLCYYPLTFLAARKLAGSPEGKNKLKGATGILFAIIGIAIGTAIAVLPVLGTNLNKLKPYVKDPFAAANMNANIQWQSWEIWIGIVAISGTIAVLLYSGRKIQHAVWILVLVQTVVIECSIIHFAPKIEGYSQATAIEYYKSFQGKDVYVAPLGFKSYAYLFYSQQMPATDSNYYRGGTEWLLNGAIDKPAFFISKNTSVAQWKGHPNLEFLGEKNGYCFYRRK